MSNSEKQETEAFFPDPIKVKVKDRETKEIVTFEISEFVFDNRVKFVMLITEILKDIYKSSPDLKKASEAEVVGTLIKVAGDKLGEIYQLVLGREMEWIKKNITLRNEIQILTAIMEVNDIPFLISQVQKTVERMAS